MNINRLKFAWARGARIQTSSDSRYSVNYERLKFWRNELRIHWSSTERPLRIHPDDEHLQYGPVSTAFRDMALFTDSADLPEEVELFMDLAGCNWVLETDGEDDVLIDWTRLFFAEYLADLGL